MRVIWLTDHMPLDRMACVGAHVACQVVRLWPSHEIWLSINNDWIETKQMRNVEHLANIIPCGTKVSRWSVTVFAHHCLAALYCDVGSTSILFTSSHSSSIFEQPGISRDTKYDNITEKFPALFKLHIVNSTLCPHSTIKINSKRSRFDSSFDECISRLGSMAECLRHNRWSKLYCLDPC